MHYWLSTVIVYRIFIEAARTRAYRSVDVDGEAVWPCVAWHYRV